MQVGCRGSGAGGGLAQTQAIASLGYAAEGGRLAGGRLAGAGGGTAGGLALRETRVEIVPYYTTILLY